MLQHLTGFPSFLRLNAVPPCIDTTFCLFILLSIATWVASAFWLLQIMLLWTQVCKYLFRILLSISLHLWNCWVSHLFITAGTQVVEMVEDWYPNGSWSCIHSRKFTFVPPFCAFLSLGKYLWADLWVFFIQSWKTLQQYLGSIREADLLDAISAPCRWPFTILRCGVGRDTRRLVTCWISHCLIDSEPANSFPTWLWVFWTAYWNCQFIKPLKYVYIYLPKRDPCITCINITFELNSPAWFDPRKNPMGLLLSLSFLPGN